MDAEDLRKLEACCEAFYSGSCPAEQAAHEFLLPIASNPACIPQLQTVLANSQSPYALIFASSSLLKLVSSSWNRITDEQKDDTKKFVLNYLYNQGPQLLGTTPALLQNLVRLLCRVVKLGWLESVRHQNITEQVGQFLQASTAHWIVGLTIYTYLTEDMQPQGRVQLTRFRRTAMSFRETALSEIFRLAIQTLQQMNAGAIHFIDTNDERKLLRQVLHLCVNCLSFDFTGTMVDDTADDQPTVMIPYSWNILREEKIPELFFSFYKKCWVSTTRPAWIESAQLCLQSLVLLSAIRRSFFQTEDERKLHITQLIEGTATIIENRLGLENDECFHELCRLLGKINAANQLLEISQTNGFSNWLNHIFDFTIKSLNHWKRLPNSQHYLMAVWSNMTGPILYLKNSAPPNIVDYVKKISIAFIDSRMHIAEAVADMRDKDIDADFEDPLADEVMRTEQLAVIASLGRCNYVEIFEHLVRLFNENQLGILEHKISPQIFQQKAAWLIYLMGVLIDTVESQSSMNGLIDRSWLAGYRNINRDESVEFGCKERESICTKMSQLVFNLMQQTDNLMSAPEDLELAYLFFLEHFRKAYITAITAQRKKRESTTDSMDDGSQKLSLEKECFGIANSSDLFTLIADKLFRNLQYRVESVAVVKKTLRVLSETVVGAVVICLPGCFSELIASGQHMLNCPIVKAIIHNHQSPQMTFLQIPKYAKFRTSYYASLTNLVLLDAPERLNDFLDQFNPLFSQLSIAASTSEAAFSSPENRQIIISLARDFRGITSSTLTGSFAILFDWLVNKPKQPGASRFEVFTRAVGVWWHDHDVMIPILKFVGEFVSDIRHRITFDHNSPNGIYLVKTVLTLFQAYGTRIMTKTDFKDPYVEKYKGVACSLHMVSAVLSGRFANLGVFEAYNDHVLSDVIGLGLEMCLSIPVQELHAYTKQLTPYYTFLDNATSDFLHYVIQLSPEALTQLLEFMDDVCCYDAAIVSCCSSIIGRLVKYYLTHKDLDTPEGQSVRDRLTANAPSLKKLLTMIFQTIVAGDFYYSLSETLFYLIVLFEDEFNKIKEQLILQQVPDRRTKLKWHFDDLMTNVDTTKRTETDRSQFSSNLYTFAGVVRSFA